MDLEKRQHILDTAMMMFNENGFHNTPTSKIAKQSGVSVGSLFNYFPTKEDLIESIYTTIKQHTKQYFLSSLEDDRTNYETLKDVWSSIIKWGVENPNEFHFIGLFMNSPFKNLKKDKTITEQYAHLKERFANKFQNNKMCTSNPQFSMEYFSSIIRTITEHILQNDIENQPQFIQSAFDLFWFGFQPE